MNKHKNKTLQNKTLALKRLLMTFCYTPRSVSPQPSTEKVPLATDLKKYPAPVRHYYIKSEIPLNTQP